MLSAVACLYLRWKGLETVSAPWIVAALVCGGLFATWVFVVTPEWVRSANDAYARRVLESLPKMGDGDALR
jgi:hypothetical protein